MQTGVDCDVEKPCKMVWTDYVWTTKSWSYMSHKYPTHPTLCTSHTSPLVSKRHTTSHKSGIPQIRQASHSDCGKASVHIPSPTGHPTHYLGRPTSAVWDPCVGACGMSTPLPEWGHLLQDTSGAAQALGTQTKPSKTFMLDSCCRFALLQRSKPAVSPCYVSAGHHREDY